MGDAATAKGHLGIPQLCSKLISIPREVFAFHDFGDAYANAQYLQRGL